MIARAAYVNFIALFLLGATIAGSAQQISMDTRERLLLELAAAERTFAATTVKEGFRDGFIKFFAEDGIGFGPHPERTREKLMKSPPPGGPRTVIFNWAPRFGDLSAAGDLGYTTGPLIFTDTSENPKPTRHGIYFSVWQKQTDSSWKVVVDMGVGTPNAVAPITTGFSPAGPVRLRRVDTPKEFSKDDLRQLEAWFSDLIAASGIVTAYEKQLDLQFRIHRKGLMPVTDRLGLAGLLSGTARFDFLDGKIAKSNDLAYAYGKYSGNTAGGEAVSGYYLHVWRLDAAGQWRLVADVLNLLEKN
jgi:ketosteroid isomerase-like protein